MRDKLFKLLAAKRVASTIALTHKKYHLRRSAIASLSAIVMVESSSSQKVIMTFKESHFTLETKKLSNTSRITTSEEVIEANSKIFLFLLT